MATEIGRVLICLTSFNNQ